MPDPTTITLAAALALTGVMALASLLGGFIAAMPDGTLVRGVTPALRLQLYVASAACLWLMGHVWLGLAH